MARFHHRNLPDHSNLLAGHTPPDGTGFQSELLQIWYNNTAASWRDPSPHLHEESDECFIVLQGRLVVEVEGERVTVGPREFCCFPRGVYHAVIEVHPPIEAFMIRAPSKQDKQYQHHHVERNLTTGPLQEGNPMSQPLKEQIISQLERLPEEQQEQVLAFVRTLAATGAKGVPGQELLRFVGLIPADDLALMARVIEDECERIDTGEW